MKLLDVRKHNIKQQKKIRFRLSSGMECVVDEHGTARIPSLAGIPDVNLEEEFAKAQRFVLESATIETDRRRDKGGIQELSRAELESAIMATGVVAGGPAHDHDDHEE